jgi:asparagine synthetase B (glutamine-hydrolysing)
MCSFLASTLALLLRLQHINYYLRFRGPDYTRHHPLGGFEFVHNLLHMTGQFTPQPFVASDNATVALFNGEIYNYRRLQAVLRPAGPPYRSDGECILEAYARWGTRFGRHFEGEFAVALFDLRRQRIVVVTDPFGVKPLFIAANGGAFGVSSYRSGLVRAGHDAASITQLEPNHVHVYTYSLAPVAATPAAAAPVSTDMPRNPAPHSFALLRTHTLVSWKLRQHKTSADGWETAFEEAVRERTSGAFRGVFLALSSGYDSGAIHLAMLRLGVPHTTFSIIGVRIRRDPPYPRWLSTAV